MDAIFADTLSATLCSKFQKPKLLLQLRLFSAHLFYKSPCVRAKWLACERLLTLSLRNRRHK